MSGQRFYFAEFEIGGTLPFEDQYDPSKSPDERKREVLIKYLKHSGAVTKTSTGNWYFGRSEEDGRLIYGKFGKVYSDEPTEYDEDLGDFVETGERVNDADYSVFVMDFDQRVMAFGSTYRVRNNNFIANFEEGFKNVIGAAAELNVELLENKEDLETILEEYPIDKLRAEVRPTNPSPDPAFEDLDESLQDMLVEKLGVEAKAADEDGINIEQEFLRQVASMSMSEYGESWQITYRDNGNLKVISSDSEPAATRTDSRVENIDELRNYASDLIDAATSYLE